MDQFETEVCQEVAKNKGGHSGNFSGVIEGVWRALDFDTYTLESLKDVNIEHGEGAGEKQCIRLVKITNKTTGEVRHYAAHYMYNSWDYDVYVNRVVSFETGKRVKELDTLTVKLDTGETLTAEIEA